MIIILAAKISLKHAAVQAHPTDRFGVNICSEDLLSTTNFGLKCDEKLEYLQLLQILQILQLLQILQIL